MFLYPGEPPSPTGKLDTALSLSRSISMRSWRQGAYGIETYYNNSRGYRLAVLIHPRVIQAMGSIDRGIRHRGYFVLRRNRLPAVLVECGFLTNPAEASRITDSSYRERIARAIAAGIVRYD